MMRTYGRVTNEDGTKSWVTVTTDAQGYNDYVYVTAFAQSLKLNLNESPFFARYGLPAKRAVQTQIAPDSCVAFMQSWYSQFFASLIVTKEQTSQPATPTYNVFIVRKNGSVFQTQVAT